MSPLDLEGPLLIKDQEMYLMCPSELEVLSLYFYLYFLCCGHRTSQVMKSNRGTSLIFIFYK